MVEIELASRMLTPLFSLNQVQLLDDLFRDEYLSDDIATTVYKKLGIPTDLIAPSPDGRPIRLIEGRPIREWM